MSRTKSVSIAPLAVLACAFTVGTAAAADDGVTGFNRSMDDKYVFQLGAYFADIDSSYRVKDKRTGQETRKIDLERVGLDKDETVPFLYGRIRFSERWRLDLQAFGTDRDATEFAGTEIDLGGAGTIPIGVEVESKFKANIYAARVGYSFLRSKRAELGAGLGLYVADFDLSIKSTFAVAGRPLPVNVSESADVTAPLPTMGLYGAYALNDKFMLEGRLNYFTLDYDKYNGHMLDAYAALEYRAFEHVGFGAGWAYFEANLDVDEDKKEEKYDIEFNGPLLYAKVGF